MWGGNAPIARASRLILVHGHVASNQDILRTAVVVLVRSRTVSGVRY